MICCLEGARIGIQYETSFAGIPESTIHHSKLFTLLSLLRLIVILFEMRKYSELSLSLSLLSGLISRWLYSLFLFLQGLVLAHSNLFVKPGNSLSIEGEVRWLKGSI